MHNIDPSRMDISKMEEAFKAMLEKSASLKETYSSTKKEITTLNKKMRNLEQYISSPANNNRSIPHQANRETSPLSSNSKKEKGHSPL